MMRWLNHPLLTTLLGLGFIVLSAYSQGYRVINLSHFDYLTQLEISRYGK